jgi:hypothetical protein
MATIIINPENEHEVRALIEEANDIGAEIQSVTQGFLTAIEIPDGLVDKVGELVTRQANVHSRLLKFAKR